MATPKKDPSDVEKAGKKPYQLTPARLKKAKQLASQGLWEKDIAVAIGLHPNHLPVIKKRHPELAEAIEKGRVQGTDKVTKALLKNVDRGNVTAQIFFLKCHAGWQEGGSGAGSESGERSKESVSRRILDNVRRVRDLRRSGGSEGASDSEGPA